MTKNNQNQPKEIKITDNVPGGEYANFMQVNHNKEEFQIVFGNIFPPSGKVVGKILTTPGHFKRMIRVMENNLKKYEEKFGEIKESVQQEEKEIGFKE